MKNPITQIRHSLSLRLSLWILLVAVFIFVVSLGFMFIRTRSYIKQDAMQRATQVLNNTAMSVEALLNEVEVATTNTDWQVRRHLTPDSISTYSRRILELNPNLFGCSIAFEPYYFPEKGQYFSIYSERNGSTIETEQEGSDLYRYFGMDWYTKPLERNEGCWIDPYYDYYIDTVYVKEMIASYGKPMLDATGHPIGVISSDLSLKWLSKKITDMKPFPRSYCIVLGKSGNYFVHPDTTKLVYQSIFTGADPETDAERICLGRDMIAGKEGMRLVHIDGEDCYVFFRPLPRTNWSLGIVYPESEIFRGYNRLFYIVLSIIVIGLILMLVLCRQIIKSAVVPINQLARQSRHIAAGNFDDRMPRSERVDGVGQLQNSFGTMQEFLHRYINDINQMNEEIERRNEELVIANEQAREADEKKTAFMQDITHQVRTPLNIIIGFSQVLQEGCDFISPEEMGMIIDAMQENSYNLTGIIDMLMTASLFEEKDTLEKDTDFGCNEICRQISSAVKIKAAGAVTLNFETTLPDTQKIHTNKEIFPKIIRHLLDNANKFTQQGTITLACDKKDDNTLVFTVTDTGIGIPEEEKENVFVQFTKLNYYAEGIGMGLTLCRRGAEMLGGTLELDATYTHGARFVLTMPV